MGATRFDVFVGPNGLVKFQLLGPDGKAVLTSRGFAHKDDCMALIRDIKESAPSPERYERRSDEGKLFFRLKAANHVVLGTSDMYGTAEEREAAISVVRHAPEAAIMEKV